MLSTPMDIEPMQPDDDDDDDDDTMLFCVDSYLPVTMVFRYFIEQTVMQSLSALLLCTVCSSTMQWVDHPFHRTQWQLILVLHRTLLLLQCSHFLVS